MNKELLNDSEWLYEKYWKDGLSTHDIAKLVGCYNGRTVRKYMNKYNIPIRSRADGICQSFVTNPERRAIYSESLKKQWEDPEFRKVKVELGRKQMFTNWEDPEFVETVSSTASVCLKTKWEDPEFRSEMSLLFSSNMTKRWEDPEFRESMSGENNIMWKGGISFEPYTDEFTEHFKEYIRKLHGRKCFLCGSYTRGRRLNIHHIDYNKKNSTLVNCVPLCCKCHGRTNSNREDWKIFFEEEWLNFLFCVNTIDIPCTEGAECI